MSNNLVFSACDTLSAAALALNVGYLWLERFRYRKQLRDFATTKYNILMKEPDSNNVSQQNIPVEENRKIPTQTSKIVRQLNWFRDIEDDPKNETVDDNHHLLSSLSLKPEKDNWRHVNCFTRLYYTHFDIRLAIAFTIASIIAIMLSCFQALNFQPSYPINDYFIIFFIVFTYSSFIYFSNKIKNLAKFIFISYCSNNCVRY